MNRYIVLDIENDNSELSQKLGRKAGCPLVGDRIVALGLKPYDSDVKSQYCYNKDISSEELEQILGHPDEHYNLIVGHNLSHDLQWFWNLDSLQDWFRNGGRIWDTQLTEYMITGQQSKYPALRDIAVNKYNCPEREKYIEKLLFNKKETIQKLSNEIKALEVHFDPVAIGMNINGEVEYSEPGFVYKSPTKVWAIREEIKHLEGHEKVSDLPRAAVLKDVESDVLDTESIYLQQYKTVEKLNMLPLIQLQMDGLLATIECSYNGMCIDIETLQKNKLKLQEELELKKQELMKIITEFWK